MPPAKSGPAYHDSRAAEPRNRRKACVTREYPDCKPDRDVCFAETLALTQRSPALTSTAPTILASMPHWVCNVKHGGRRLHRPPEVLNYTYSRVEEAFGVIEISNVRRSSRYGYCSRTQPTHKQRPQTGAYRILLTGSVGPLGPCSGIGRSGASRIEWQSRPETPKHGGCRYSPR